MNDNNTGMDMMEKEKATAATVARKMEYIDSSITIDSDICNEIVAMGREMARMKMKPSCTSPVKLVPAFEVESKPMSWLVKGLLARGLITLLAGQSGIGKSLMAYYLASLVSNGESFDGNAIQQGRVLIWSGEEPMALMKARLEALGADLDYIEFIGEEVFDSGTVRPFDITVDLPLIEQTVMNWNSDTIPYSLLIVDPVMSAVYGDPHKASHVRQSMEPLRLLAERIGMAVLCISHFSKGSAKGIPQDRVIGSQAFVALSRIALGLVKEDETGTRRLVTLKSNITDTLSGYDFSYQFREDGNGFPVADIQLAGKVKGRARELMAEFEPEELETGAVANATVFLKDILQDGVMTVRQIEVEARGAGFSMYSIRTAARKLGVDMRKDKGVNGVWRWALPSG